MNSYEQNQIEQIKEWKNEVPSVVSQAVGTILKPVTWVVSLVIPSKAIKGALLGCDKIAEFLTDTNDIKRDANVSAISELAHKDLELSDKLANEIHNWAVGTATLEGAGTGLLGLPGLIADIPALITQSLRVIHKIGLCYGFECKTEQDKQLVFGIMSVAGANTVEEKTISVALLRNINVMIVRNTWKKLTEAAVKNKYGVAAAVIGIKSLAKRLGINITKRKALQSIPVIGAGVGAAMNAKFLNDVAWAARRTFQERWLIVNNKIEECEYEEI